MTAIKQFKRLFLLETYNKKAYIFEEDKAIKLDKLMETVKFVNIGGSRINVSNICEYSPIPSQPVYDYIVALPDAIRGIGLQFLKDYEKDQSSLPTMKSLSDHIRRKFRIPSDKVEGFDSFQEFSIYFLHKNYPNDI